MATEKQIAANRINALRSTGPRTLRGKSRSSRNALQHGLSISMLLDGLTMETANELTRIIAGNRGGLERLSAAQNFALAHLKTRRIELVRAKVISALDANNANSVRSLETLDRYERLALTERRRAQKRFAQHNE